jgi:hypothetical protein
MSVLRAGSPQVSKQESVLELEGGKALRIVNVLSLHILNSRGQASRWGDRGSRGGGAEGHSTAAEGLCCTPPTPSRPLSGRGRGVVAPKPPPARPGVPAASPFWRRLAYMGWVG